MIIIYAVGPRRRNAAGRFAISSLCACKRGGYRVIGHRHDWRPKTMKKTLIAALFVLASAPVCAGVSGLKVVKEISGPDGHWDLVNFDPVQRRVYIAHGDDVLVIDADSGRVHAGFAQGSHLHAVVPVPGTDRLVTTNSGDKTARVLDAANGKVLASIPGPADTDSAAYDPATRDVVVIGGDSGEIELIDPRTMKSTGSLKIGGALEFGVPDGKGRFFINGEEANDIEVVDLKSLKVVAHYPMPECQRPTGLAYVEGDRLVSSCQGKAEILSAADGRVIASLPIGAGPDAVIYDPKRHLALIPSGRAGTLSVIALEGPQANTVIDTVQTQVGARTGTVDPKTGRVWLPTAKYAPPAQPGGRPTTVAGTFHVLVLDR
jgi:DNA-binding beta-propeller fold protein YncE